MSEGKHVMHNGKKLLWFGFRCSQFGLLEHNISHVTKYHRFGGVNKKIFVSHSSRVWEVQDQCTDRFSVW